MGDWPRQLGGPVIVRKTADETVNNSTALQDDNELVLPVGENERWLIEMTLLLTTPSDNPDWKFGWSVPAGTTLYWGIDRGYEELWAWKAIVGAGDTAILLTSGTGGSTIGSVVRVLASVGGTAGNVQFRWAQSSAVAENTKILAESFLLATKLA